MYIGILKKDLKRKKTMNFILLVFIILAATFISSSVNNVISITTAMNHYFEKAELKDFMLVTMKEEKNDKAIEDFLNQETYVEHWVVDENLYLTGENIELPNGNDFALSNTALISSFRINQQKFFDKNDQEIASIKDGYIYIPLKLMEENHLKAGDDIQIVAGDFKKTFTIAGNVKDAFLGSTMMGVTRLLVSDKDYLELESNTDFSCGKIYSIETSDIEQLEQDFNKTEINVIVSCDQKLITTTYIMDMIIAGVLLITSVCLILISLVILRFTIVFTLYEEFREIGIMKAIGIKERKIRGLYIIKYLAISIIGAMIGFLCSIPFGNMFMKQVSKNIVITNNVGIIVNFILSAFIVIIVILFCYFCTRRVNKFSPVDAIRNGSNGERFQSKSKIKLSKSKLSTRIFMAWNDILSEPKKFGVLALIFTIGFILIIVPINTINTLKSDRLVEWFGMTQSDVYLTNEFEQNKYLTVDGRNAMEQFLQSIEENLKGQGIEAKAFGETVFKFKISLREKSYISMAIQGTGVSADQYTYTKGLPPMYENEVALTHITADKISAVIGDTVRINIGDTEKDYIVTAIYQSMNNMGEGIRFSEKEELNYNYAFGSFAIQIKYQDNPAEKEVQSRREIIKSLYPDYDINTGGEYIGDMMGNIAGQIDGIRNIIIMVIMLINMLVAILMEKSFITKDKGEIGMLKSIGFPNKDIIKWQVVRMGIVMLISTVLAAVLSNPITQVTSGKIFELMGSSHIEFEIKPLEVFVMYPLLIFIMTLLACGITALSIGRISAQETNNIE